MRVCVLVPYRSDGGRRDHLWSFVRARMEANHPDWPIHVGVHDDGGPFNRSAALNSAARDAGAWAAAVILDADAIIDPEQLRAAVRKAYALDAFVIAYERYCYLNRRTSDLIIDGYRGDWWPGVEWTMTNTCSTIVTVSRRLWDRVGGFDEGFRGWGFEDCAFSVACDALGSRQRVPGEVWHLWHPPSTENNRAAPEWQANLARLNRYSAVQYDSDAVRDLLAELGVTSTVDA